MSISSGIKEIGSNFLSGIIAPSNPEYRGIIKVAVLLITFLCGTPLMTPHGRD
jgi:hypothetical protein